MRKQLKEIGAKNRNIFYGTFERTGYKNGYKGPIQTVLLLNIKDEKNNVVCDHLWFNMTKGFEKLKLIKGDEIKFNARVQSYEKGYKGYRDDVWDHPIEKDYKLSYPTKIEKI